MESSNQSQKSSPEPDQDQARPETNPSLGFAIVLALALLVGMGYLWQTYSRAEEIPQWMKGLGQLHPVAVHMPIALIAVVFLMELLGLCSALRHLKQSTKFLLWIAVLSASAAMALGYMLKLAGGQSGEILDKHMWAGVAVVAGGLASLMLRSTGGGLLYGLVLTLTLFAVATAGHLGGSMAHGSSYLTKYMPDDWELKKWLAVENWVFSAGCSDCDSDGGAEGAPEGDGDRTVYEVAIAPILEAKCVQCHGEEKTKGKLRLDDYALALESEGVIVPGDVDASELMVRIDLPGDDEDVMPPEDEEPLTDDERAILTWWVTNDGTASLKMADAELPEEIVKAIDALPKADAGDKGKDESEAKADDGGAAKEDTGASQALDAEVAKLNEAGYAVRAISQEDSALEFNAVNVADEFNDEALALFVPLGDPVRELNLARTAVTDAGMDSLGALSGLVKLHLEGTAITDAGLAKLASLQNLEWLNLYGTKITDSGLKHLEKLPKLRKVFVWETGVTDEGVAALVAANSEVEVEQGWDADDLPAPVEPPAPAPEKKAADAKPEAPKDAAKKPAPAKKATPKEPAADKAPAAKPAPAKEESAKKAGPASKQPANGGAKKKGGGNGSDAPAKAPAKEKAAAKEAPESKDKPAPAKKEASAPKKKAA